MAGQLQNQYDIYDTGVNKQLIRGVSNELDIMTSAELLSQDPSISVDVGFGGGLTNPVEQVVLPSAITSGELPSILAFGKKTFTDTTAGFRMGVDSNNTYKWIIGDSTSSVDWNVTTANTLTVVGTITATSGTIGGWNITSTTLYNLQSGTPTSSPNDGVVIESGNEAIIIYEDTAKRIELGYLSAGVYGLKGYDTGGSTVLFELSDSQTVIAGWTISSTTLANSTNIILDASNKAISINNATFGNDGIQLEYNTGNPRCYIGDGLNEFFKFDGTNISWNTPNSSLSTTGKITTISADIGGWNVISGYIYNLQSGTPIATPNDGIVIASGNEVITCYEDTEKRLEVGYLSAGVYGLKTYNTNGTTVNFEVSDTQQMIAGWTFTETALYNLASGTPTSSPNDGLVFVANSTPAVIAYEDTAKRVELGYLSAGIFGLKGYATNGTTVIFELSDTQQKIAGWNFTDLVIRTGSTDANSNVLIDSANSLMRLGPTTGDYITMDGANKRIRSSDYVSGVAGAGFTLEPDLLEVGNISARGIIRTAVFQKSVISSVGGSFAVVDSDKLNVDMSALDASTLTISGNTTFAVNDLLRIKDGVDDEWFEVTNAASAPTYTVTRDKAAAYTADNNPAWKNGASVVNYGASGEGLVYMTASDTNAPFLSVLTHAGSPWSTLTTQLRLGNLNGYLGYVADTYGLGIGSSSGTDANITIEATNGIRIRNGTTNKVTFDNSGNATLLNLTVGGSLNVSTSGNLKSGQTAYNTGTGWFLEYNGGTPRSSIGDGTATNSVTWDGTTLLVNGSAISGQILYGDGNDGTVTISSNTSLSRDMYYNDLTINSGFTLNPAGYKIFVKGTLTIQSTAAIARNGNNGSAGAAGTTSGGAVGTAASALASGTLAGTVASGDGAAGNAIDDTASNGSPGTNTTDSFGVNGVSGGGGGAGNGGGASSGGDGGTVTAAVSGPRNLMEASIMRNSQSGSFNQITSSASSGGGGGGGGRAGGPDGGGGGGGGGGPGAVVFIAAKIIVNNGSITATGGNGGNGGSGRPTGINCGGGGGGGAGSGGVVVYIYRTKSGSGTYTVAAGTVGTGGQGIGNPAGTPDATRSGTNGTAGNTGVVVAIQE